jgi:aspartate/methionine/tyrosine aminotransferase
MFNSSHVDLRILKQRAFNLRWATQPEGVIPLTAADPDFPCAPEITEAISKYIKDRYLSYGPAQGMPALRESIAQYYFNKRSFKINPDYILPVDSAAFGIYLVCKSFLKPLDEAIIFDPVDFLFRYSIETVGAVAIPLSIDPVKQTLDMDLLEQLISPKCKMICLCNPLNPSGKSFTKRELTLIGEFAEKHNLIILSDEIWSDIIFTPNEYVSMASINSAIANRTITVHGFSKSYGLAGLRIGMLLCSNPNYFQLIFQNSLHQSTVHGVNMLSQVAAISALNECGYWLDAFVLHLQKMRNYVVSSMNDIPGISCHLPDSCYVAFPNIIQTNKTSEVLYQYLLDEAKVAIVPGLKQWFGEGAEGYIRICFSTSDEILSEAMHRIKIAMNKI